MSCPPPSRHLLRARELVDAHYREPIAVADMARAARLSRAHFSREFHRTFGETPQAYLVTRRLERAASLLRLTDWSVAEICLSVGWRSQGSFTTTFTRTFGLPPNAYRRRFPPAKELAWIPGCVIRAYSRPQHRTYGEDARPVGP